MVLHRPGVYPGGHHRLDQVGQLTQLVCLELSQSAVLFILKVKNILKYTSTHSAVRVVRPYLLVAVLRVLYIIKVQQLS